MVLEARSEIWREVCPGHRQATGPSPQATLLAAHNGPTPGILYQVLLTQFLINF